MKISHQISGGNFLPELCGEVQSETALSRVCAVPLARQKRALFEGARRAKRHREKGRKRCVITEILDYALAVRAKITTLAIQTVESLKPTLKTRTPQIRGSSFPPQFVWGGGGHAWKKHCKTRDFWRFTPPKFGGVNFTSQIWGYGFVFFQLDPKN